LKKDPIHPSPLGPSILTHGQYTGHTHEPTIILEAVASKDLWIWHDFFGLPESLDDINIFHRSHLFAKLVVKGRLQKLITQSMVIIIQWGIILLIESILNVPHLLNPYEGCGTSSN
jgi:hypothetical protein